MCLDIAVLVVEWCFNKLFFTLSYFCKNSFYILCSALVQKLERGDSAKKDSQAKGNHSNFKQIWQK
jgi:hypothetical protein